MLWVRTTKDKLNSEVDLIIFTFLLCRQYIVIFVWILLFLDDHQFTRAYKQKYHISDGLTHRSTSVNLRFYWKYWRFSRQFHHAADKSVFRCQEYDSSPECADDRKQSHSVAQIRHYTVHFSVWHSRNSLRNKSVLLVRVSSTIRYSWRSYGCRYTLSSKWRIIRQVSEATLTFFWFIVHVYFLMFESILVKSPRSSKQPLWSVL